MLEFNIVEMKFKIQSDKHTFICIKFNQFLSVKATWIDARNENNFLEAKATQHGI